MKRLFLFLPGWIAFMAYLPALQNGFVWDDTYFLSDMPYLRDPLLWWQHIREPLFVSQNYFRPLPLLSFVLEAQFGPLNPFVFHLSNLLLHAANVTLVVLLARRLAAADGSTNPWRPFIAGLLFGLHPVLIETVSWISDRFDLMMAFFLLFALWCDIALRDTAKKTVAIGALFLLALLCKETSIVFLGLLPLWQLVRAGFDKDSWRGDIRRLIRQSWPTWAALFIATIFYFALRYQSLGVFYRTDTVLVPGTLLQHALLCAKTLGWYFVLLCWPFGQIGPVHPGVTPVPVNDFAAWLGALSIIAVATAIAMTLRRAPRAGLLLCIALLALAPVANLMPLTIGDNIAHDRYLLLPLAFVSLAIAVMPPPRLRIAAAATGTVWLALSLTAIVVTVPYWESNLSLWNWAHALEPASKIARGNYVAALANAGYNEEVVKLCGDILREHPRDAGAMHDKALALMRLGRTDEARRYSEMSLKYLDRFDAKGLLDRSEALNLLGYLDLQDRNLDAAEESLTESIRLTPYLTRPHFNLAMVHYGRGQIDAGDSELAFALRYDSPELAIIHRTQAQKKRAEALARQTRI